MKRFLFILLLIQISLFSQTTKSYNKEIISFGKDLNIKGNVNTSLFIVKGRLELEGYVKEDVIAIASDVFIKEGTRIDGDLIIIGGHYDKKENIKVNGEFIHIDLNLNKIESTFLPLFSEKGVLSVLRLIKIGLWFILVLIVFSLISSKIPDTLEIIEKNLGKTGIIGIITIFSFLFLFVLFVIMSLFLIGLPLLFLLIIVYFILFAVGRTIILYFIGNKISEAFNLKTNSAVVFLLFGILFYAILKFLPFIGFIGLIILNIFEIGAGLIFFFRKKFS